MRIATPRTPRASARAATALLAASGAASWCRPLVWMDRRRALIELLRGWRAIFRGPGLLLVVAAGRRRLRAMGAHALHVPGELPNLLGGHLVAKRRHPMRTAVADRGKNRYRFRAVIPPAVEERRPDAALPVAVTALAGKPGIQPLALREIVGVGLVRLVQREIDVRRRATDAVRHQGDLIQRSRRRRIQPKLSLLPLASRRGSRDQKHQKNPHERIAAPGTGTVQTSSVT